MILYLMEILWTYNKWSEKLSILFGREGFCSICNHKMIKLTKVGERLFEGIEKRPS